MKKVKEFYSKNFWENSENNRKKVFIDTTIYIQKRYPPVSFTKYLRLILIDIL
jgi:hypothetical protein